MLYHCVICELQLDPKAESTWHQVVCWVKQGKNTNIKSVDKLFRYAHGICVESPPKEQAERLFD